MSSQANRRGFLRDTLLVSAGVVGSTLLPSALRLITNGRNNTVHAADDDHRSAEDSLRELGIDLPPAPKPVAVYVPTLQSGSMLYASGHGPRRADGTTVQGKVGADLTLEQGYEAARLVGLNVLSSVRSTLGSLDKVKRLVKVLGMVNSTADFKQHPKVINGFS